MDKPHPLAAEWRREADLYERRGLTTPAAMARSFADELAAWEIEHGLEALPLSVAAKESGLSLPHLSRLLSEKRIENVGVTNHPRIRRKDLPRKVAPRPDDGPDLAGRVKSAQNRRIGEVG